MLISLLISAISYAKIYFRLCHLLLHVQGHVHQRQHLPPNGVVPTALNLARYKKTVSAITWVQLGLIACYSPFCITLNSLHFEKVFEREYNLLFPLFTILKLISKPYSLLLENQGGETGSKGHSSTVKLLLWAKLNLCVMKNHVKLCGKKKTAGIKYKLYSDY